MMRTIDRASPHENVFPTLLGLIAGMVDVTGWLTLGGVFTAHITGNLVVIAANVADGRPIHLVQAVAVPLFIAVAATTGGGTRALGLTARGIERALLAAQSSLLIVGAIVAFLTSPWSAPYGPSAGVIAVCAMAAMANQNTLLHLTRPSTPATAVMTGNVIVCTLALVGLILSQGMARDEARAHWGKTWPVLAGFIGGLAIGAVCVRVSPTAAWVLAALASVLTDLWSCMASPPDRSRQRSRHRHMSLAARVLRLRIRL